MPIFSVYVPKDDSFKKISEENSNVVIYRFSRDLINSESMNSLDGKSALYFLFNEIENNKIALYIGETEDILKRVKDHNKDDSKDFSNIICVVNEKEDFNKTKTLYLEQKSIKMAKDNPKIVLINSNGGKKTTITPEAQESLDDLLVEIKRMLSIFGYGHLLENKVKEISENDKKVDLDPEQRNEVKNRIFYLYSAKKEGGKEIARAVYKDGRMTLLKGSKITKEPKDSFKKNKEAAFKKYTSYIEDTSLTKEEDDFFVLQQDLEFTSVSYPSDIVKGHSTNGWLEWKNIDGKTMDEIYRK